MQKSKIIIASSSRYEVLAEKLRDQLETNYSEAELWKDEIRGRPTETTIEMLEGATEKYDFAIIVLGESDVNVNMGGDPLKDRDNRFFEAGFFIAALGRERCFIVNSEAQPYLPPDLTGITAVHFKEPDCSTLRDRGACAEAMKGVGSQILDSMEKVKTEKNRPLSKETLLDREQKRPDGELGEDNIVVNVTPPIEIAYATACQVRMNMDAGIDYTYCCHGGLGCVLRICQLLQMLLIAPMLDDANKAVYQCRMEKLRQKDIQDKIIADLEKICESQHLKIYLLPDPPELEYVIHNANSETDAILYIKHKDTFIEWERGDSAYKIWGEVRKRLGIYADSSNAVFCGASGFKVKEGDFYRILKNEMKKAFPVIDEKVVKLCCDGL
jgi:hypothetical protein